MIGRVGGWRGGGGGMSSPSARVWQVNERHLFLLDQRLQENTFFLIKVRIKPLECLSVHDFDKAAAAHSVNVMGQSTSRQCKCNRLFAEQRL